MRRLSANLMLAVWIGLAIFFISTFPSDTSRSNARAESRKPQAQVETPDVGHACQGIREKNPNRPAGAWYWGRCLAARRGWTGKEWKALDNLWTWESGWNFKADNPTSTAYGIPQCLSSVHPECAWPKYIEKPLWQIRWGFRYIDSRYNGMPSVAWKYHQARCSSELSCWY